MHLTNYSINYKNNNFEFNTDLSESNHGHKRTFTSILDFISHNFEDGPNKVKELKHKIELIIIRTLVCV